MPPVKQPFWLPSGPQSTHPTVQISRATSDLTLENRLLKKRMARPLCKGIFGRHLGSASTYPVSGLTPAKMGSARPDSHKANGDEHDIFNQDVRTPVRPLCHLSSTSTDIGSDPALPDRYLAIRSWRD
jgi:hypothetical protein